MAAVAAPQPVPDRNAMSEALLRFLRDEDEAEASSAPADGELDLEHLDITSTSVSLEGRALALHKDAVYTSHSYYCRAL